MPCLESSSSQQPSIPDSEGLSRVDCSRVQSHINSRAQLLLLRSSRSSLQYLLPRTTSTLVLVVAFLLLTMAGKGHARSPHFGIAFSFRLLRRDPGRNDVGVQMAFSNWYPELFSPALTWRYRDASDALKISRPVFLLTRHSRNQKGQKSNVESQKLDRFQIATAAA